MKEQRQQNKQRRTAVERKESRAGKKSSQAWTWQEQQESGNGLAHCHTGANRGPAQPGPACGPALRCRGPQPLQRLVCAQPADRQHLFPRLVPHLQHHIAPLQPQQLCHVLCDAFVGLPIHRLGVYGHIQRIRAEGYVRHLQAAGEEGARVAQGSEARCTSQPGRPGRGCGRSSILAA